MNENGTPGQDPTGAEPTPPPPPQQPPAATPPQQPAPPTPAAAQPAPQTPQPGQYPPQPGQPPKKSRKGIIIAVIVIVLLLLLCCCGIVGVSMYSASQEDAAAQEQAEQIIVHMNAVDEAAASLETIWAGWNASPDLDAPFPIEETTIQLDVMRSELSSAESVALDMRESTFKREILDAIEQSQIAIDLYESTFTSLGSLVNLLGTVEDLADRMSTANDQLNDAVSLMNKEDYADGKKKAQQAEAGFKAVATESRTLAAEYPDSEADKLAAIADKSAEQAGHVVKQGDLGPKNSVSKYNDEVNAYNDLTGEIAALPYPAWFEDPEMIMATVEANYQEAEASATAADEALARAQAALDAGEY